MAWVFNPFTGTLDQTGSGGGTPGGSDTQIQFNDGGSTFGGDADLTWNKTTNVMTVTGDVNLSDGGTYTTTLQTITPTANRTVSIPDATGTLALVAGSSGQPVYNNAGAYAGLSTATIGATGNISLSLNGASGVSPVAVTGSWFVGTTPQVLIQPSNVGTAGSWSPNGTGLGVNAASGFTGRLLDLQVNGTSRISATDTNLNVNITGSASTPSIGNGSSGIYFSSASGNLYFTTNGVYRGAIFASGDWSLASNSSLNWESGGAASSFDLTIRRDAANTLAQRNGTNAQTFRVYNTFTDASNYERGFLRWSSNVFEVGPEAAGTGTARPMRITAATLKLPNLPTYADNAAATTGGLVAGDVYKTATGELRITV